MKSKKIIATVLIMTLLIATLCINLTPTLAATIGDEVTSPEDGWTRYDDSNSYFIYNELIVGNKAELYNGAHHYVESATTDSYVKFRFSGTQLRIVDMKAFNRTTNAIITIDGETESYSLYNSNTLHQVIVYEKTNLDEGMHEVIISVSSNGDVLSFDAIDINEDGQLMPYYQVEGLKATPGDAQVTLTWDPIADASEYIIHWGTESGTYSDSITVPSTAYSGYDITSLINGTTYYFAISAVVNTTESTMSLEVSATPTAPVAESVSGILRIMLDNGLVKEYELSDDEIDAFITWYGNRGDGNGRSYFTFKNQNMLSAYESHSEYIIYDKITYFEVLNYIVE